jgi:hypothetical protein
MAGQLLHSSSKRRMDPLNTPPPAALSCLLSSPLTHWHSTNQLANQGPGAQVHDMDGLISLL